MAAPRECAYGRGSQVLGVESVMAAAIWSGAGIRRVFAVAAVAAVGLTWTAAAAQASAGRRSPAGTITTVAGGPGGPGPATNVSIRACGLKSAGGALYFAAGAIVRRVDARTGRLTTVTAGLPSGSCGLSVDSAGNVLVADATQLLVVAGQTGRFDGRPMVARHVYVLACRRQKAGHVGNGGLASRALLTDAVDVALDRAGNVVIADSGSPQDREIAAVGAEVRVVARKTGRFYGRKMTAGHIYAVAGTATGGSRRNGGLATRTSLGVAIGQVRVDSNGNLVLADLGVVPYASLARSVRVIAVRTGRFYGQQMSAGHIYSIAGNGRSATRATGGPGRKAALGYGGGSRLIDAGNVVIADCGEVRVVAARTGRLYGRHMAAGHIYAVAGQPGPASLGYCLGSHDAGDGGPGQPGQCHRVGSNRRQGRQCTARRRWRLSGQADRHPDRPASTAGTRAPAISTWSLATGTIESSGNGLLATRAELAPEAVTTDRAGDVLTQDASQLRMVPRGVRQVLRPEDDQGRHLPGGLRRQPAPGRRRRRDPVEPALHLHRSGRGELTRPGMSWSRTPADTRWTSSRRGPARTTGGRCPPGASTSWPEPARTGSPVMAARRPRRASPTPMR